MRSILYLSSATRPITDLELVDILTISRKNIERVGVSGMLLYRGGNFIQVLEGPDAAVGATYSRIEKDPRHDDITLILDEQVDVPRFREWSMGFQNINKLTGPELAGVSHFLKDDSLADALMQHPDRVYLFLLAFREMMR
jgi:hypothetical protein